MKIKITTKNTGTIEAELTDENPDTVKAFLEALPLTGKANTWGDEIYFTVPVDAEVENPKTVVEMGDLAFWPLGNAFCIFFGPTPMSSGHEIKPASEVNVLGKVIGDPKVFKKVQAGDEVVVEVG